MPQQDRHKNRIIPIEFDFYNTLDALPKADRCSIIMISCGSATLKINEQYQTLDAPCVLCISHYDKISLTQLTELVHLNRTTLNQRFKQQHNCTCIEYLLNYRLKMAQELLSNTKLKISAISEQCGFKYDSYFIRQFTKHLGITPSEFRKDPTGYSAYEGNKLVKL